MVSTIATIVGVCLIVTPSVLRSNTDESHAKRVYPNPFTDKTTFQLTMPTPGVVSVAVYDIQGRLIVYLKENEHVGQGIWDVTWDGRDARGNVVPPGVYVCSLFSANRVVNSVKVVKIG